MGAGVGGWCQGCGPRNGAQCAVQKRGWVLCNGAVRRCQVEHHLPFRWRRSRPSHARAPVPHVRGCPCRRAGRCFVGAVVAPAQVALRRRPAAWVLAPHHSKHFHLLRHQGDPRERRPRVRSRLEQCLDVGEEPNGGDGDRVVGGGGEGLAVDIDAVGHLGRVLDRRRPLAHELVHVRPVKRGGAQAFGGALVASAESPDRHVVPPVCMRIGRTAPSHERTHAARG